MSFRDNYDLTLSLKIFLFLVTSVIRLYTFVILEFYAGLPMESALELVGPMTLREIYRPI